jgi:predicted ATPase
MKIREVSIAGYRSLRAIRFPVGQLTVFVGANGVGKTNLYRALQLLQASAAGTLARELASEGGMESALWAGKRPGNKPARIKLLVGLGSETDRTGQSSFDYDVEIGVAHSYEIEVGVRMPTAAAFALEPQVKEEALVFHGAKRPLSVLKRKGPRATAIDDDGRKHALGTDLLASETALGALRDPGRFGDIELVRRTLQDWRFYHDFRSDRDSPLRASHVLR